jgi:ankyrin repeat protein
MGDIASICILLDYGADIHQKAEGGTTALMAAACVDSNKAEYLIQRGANIHESDHEGDTPLHVAVGFPWDDQAKASRAKMVKVLLAHGAQNVPGKDGKTPMDLAQQEKLTEVVQLIQVAVQKRKQP